MQYAWCAKTGTIALPQGGKKFDDISVQSFGHNTAALDRQTDGRKWQNNGTGVRLFKTLYSCDDCERRWQDNIASCVIYGGDWSRVTDDSSDL